MEQQEKKMRKDQRGRIQWKSTWSFPNDLTAEILSWLPEKSVARFRCVSKLWSSIITDRYFINWSEIRSPRASILLCKKHGNKLYVALIPQHTRSSNKFYSSSQPIYSYHIHLKLTQEYNFFPYRMESVHGLVCFTESRPPVVLNPSTRQFLTLPKPDMTSTHMVFFGYDPIEGKHKVVCVPYKETCYDYESRVFTLGSHQESWRILGTNPKHLCGYSSGRCIKGVIYYVAHSRNRFGKVIMSFDVRSEKFHMIELPSKTARSLLITYKGKLACADFSYKTRLWILEDTEKHKWSFQDFLSPFSDPSFVSPFKLKGCTHAGEFIYLPYELHKAYYILFYDPVRNSCRRFELEGIVDDQSRLRVENGLIYTFDACPNHIES